MDLLEESYMREIKFHLEKISKSLASIADSLKKTDSLPEYKIENHFIKHKNYYEEDGNIHKNAWVVLGYNQCITTMPPKYLSTIFHYYDEDGLRTEFLGRNINEKVFFTKKDAINYCISLGTEYQIIDVPSPKSIVIGDDYE